MLKVPKALVSVNWLSYNFNAENLIVLNGTLPKITIKSETIKLEENQILGSLFFDIKNQFSVKNAEFPNTVLDFNIFENKAQELGVHQDSCIVVYDEYGIYSSARVWWLFKLMGFDNIAVLDGGFSAWKKGNFQMEKKQENKLQKGNFKVSFKTHFIKDYKQVLENINSQEFLVADARSKERFLATSPEPRKKVRGGRIPNSVSLPYSEVLNRGLLKKDQLTSIFKKVNPKNKPFIFSCGSGITACILALAAEISGIKKYTVYNGSWTEWGSKLTLPIEK